MKILKLFNDNDYVTNEELTDLVWTDDINSVHQLVLELCYTICIIRGDVMTMLLELRKGDKSIK